MFVDPYLATITVFAGNFAPRAWQFCDGSLLAIASNTALFSLIGTTYGGDGQTTFALPDLRGRYAVHAGQGPGLPNYNIGERGGMEKVTLLSPNLPPHNHFVVTVTGQPGGSEDGGSQSSPENGVPADVATRYSTLPGDASMAVSSTIVTTAMAGGTTPVSNISPYLAMNYVICTEGIYPSRN